MKKIISLIGIVAIMFSTILTAYAGDVPEALSYEDDAKIFIGTLKDFKLDSDKPKVLDVQVLPTRKIKGDVAINELQTYKMCHFGKLVQKEKEYLFGWLSDDSVWAYEIINYNEKEIKIETYDEFAKRIWINVNKVDSKKRKNYTDISNASFWLGVRPLLCE